METTLPDGLYGVDAGSITAGFVVAGGRVTRCAPILRRKLGYWVTVAKRLPDPPPFPLTCHLCRHQQPQRGPCEACGAPADAVRMPGTIHGIR